MIHSFLQVLAGIARGRRSSTVPPCVWGGSAVYSSSVTAALLHRRTLLALDVIAVQPIGAAGFPPVTVADANHDVVVGGRGAAAKCCAGTTTVSSGGRPFPVRDSRRTVRRLQIEDVAGNF